MPLQTTIFGVRFRFVPTSKFKWSSFDEVRCSINSDAITEELKSKIDPAVPQQFCSKVVKFLFKKVLFRAHVISKLTRYYQPDWLWWRYHVQLYIAALYFIWDLGCGIWSIKIPKGQYRDNLVGQLTIVVVAQTHIGDSAFFTQGQQGWTFIWSHSGQIGSLPT